MSSISITAARITAALGASLMLGGYWAGAFDSAGPARAVVTQHRVPDQPQPADADVVAEVASPGVVQRPASLHRRMALLRPGPR